MTFFNKKEEVINIELTPYGRSLLAKGRLLPSYYAFFDDDILYDVMAAHESDRENQKDITNRILKETPRLKAQRDLQSPEKLIFRNERTQENIRPHTELKLNYLTEPLGTSDQTSVYGPAWKTTFLRGEITGSVQTVLTGSDVYLRQIPQINSTIEYTMQIKDYNDVPPVRGVQSSRQEPAYAIFPDGTYLDLISEQIICQLKEKEGFLLKDGLEMSVYLYEETKEVSLLPLKFRPRQFQIVDGILQDEELPPSIIIDPSYVDYWFNMFFDSEIPPDEICLGIQKLKTQDVELELEVECPDTDGIDYNIYGTRIADADVEKCD